MKSQKTNRLQNYELSKLRTILDHMELITDFKYINFSQIYTGEKFNYPTNEEEADKFVKDRIRLLIWQDMRNEIQQVKKILFTDFDMLF